MQTCYVIEVHPRDGSASYLMAETDAEEAKKKAAFRIEMGDGVRVFALIEVYHCVNAKVAKIADEKRRLLAEEIALQVNTPLKPERRRT